MSERTHTDLEGKLKDTTLSLMDHLKHIERLEEINETWYFNFDRSMGNITNSAIYILIRKAFTPFAAMHMLKQMQLAIKYREDVTLVEKKPLTLYSLKVPNY